MGMGWRGGFSNFRMLAKLKKSPVPGYIYEKGASARAAFFCIFRWE